MTPELQDSEAATKQTIASDVARTFDVMGWCSPAVAKIENFIAENLGVRT